MMTIKERKSMSATATRGLPREQVAEQLLELLTEEPQSPRELAGVMGYGASGERDVDTSSVNSALQILEARGDVKRVSRGAYVLASSKLKAAQAAPTPIKFPYRARDVRFDQMFVDKDYQRPLTSFAETIYARFDPELFQTLIVSDRGPQAKPRYALIDGQTRWFAARRLGIQEGPCSVFVDLTPEKEASLCWRYQKHRRGTPTPHRFKAQLASGDPESMAIKELVESIGYQVGDGKDKIQSIAALEYCFRADEFLLARVLSDYWEAWPEVVPGAKFIRGLHYFFRNYPIGDPAARAKNPEIDDEKLVRRLKTAGPDGLEKKLLAIQEISGGKGSREKLVALAIQSAYSSGK